MVRASSPEVISHEHVEKGRGGREGEREGEEEKEGGRGKGRTKGGRGDEGGGREG